MSQFELDSVPPAMLDRAALDGLLEMTGGDPEFLAEMIDTFLADGQALLTDMQTAVAGGDVVALRRAAHTMKSNSRTFGAMAYGDLCQEIEERAAGGTIDGVAGLIDRVRNEYPAVAAALNAERPNP